MEAELDEQVCPLCCEELDLSDQNFLPCKCGYQVCMWCWHHIKENLNGLCPACRTPYQDDPHAFAAVDRNECVVPRSRHSRRRGRRIIKNKKERKQKEKEKERKEQLAAAAAAAAARAKVRASPSPSRFRAFAQPATPQPAPRRAPTVLRTPQPNPRPAAVVPQPPPDASSPALAEDLPRLEDERRRRAAAAANSHRPALAAPQWTSLPAQHRQPSRKRAVPLFLAPDSWGATDDLTSSIWSVSYVPKDAWGSWAPREDPLFDSSAMAAAAATSVLSDETSAEPTRPNVPVGLADPNDNPLLRPKPVSYGSSFWLHPGTDDSVWGAPPPRSSYL